MDIRELSGDEAAFLNRCRGVWAEGDGLAFPALQVPGHQALIWPFGMIARRLSERAETTFEGIIGGVETALVDLGAGR